MINVDLFFFFSFPAFIYFPRVAPENPEDVLLYMF